jgi:hypothetical protein
MRAFVQLLIVTTGVSLLLSCQKTAKPVPQTNDYTLTLRPDSTTAQDSYVALIDNDPADGNTNLNFAHELVMARWTLSWYNFDSATWRGYLRFDSLAKIPATATVTSAILYLYGEGTDSSASFPFGDSYPSNSSYSNGALIQMVTGGTWQQDSITWNNAPAATSAGQDTIPPSTSSWNYNVSVDITNLVKQQVASPKTNFGYLLKLQTEQNYRAMEFATSECPDSLERPMLVVKYSTTTN